MADLLTAAQMRAVETAAISSGDVSGLELMERAGAGVVEAVFRQWPDLTRRAHRAVVLCGPGNNGGDGFVIARLLVARGWEVELYLYGQLERLPPDARRNAERWLEIGRILPLEPGFEASSRRAALVVDALFGTGLSRPVTDLGATLLDLSELRGEGAALSEGERPDWTPLIVAVDLPSGLCSDSGRVLRDEHFVGLPEVLEAASAAADLTVTFHARKLGHVLAEGPELCGTVVVVPLGLEPRRSRAPRGERVAEVTAPWGWARPAGTSSATATRWC